MAKYTGVSMLVARRLPRYYRYLTLLKEKGVQRISSREFSEIIGFTASQIRQDLNCFGGFGQQGYGYNVEVLRDEIGKILCVNQNFPAILIGAGNLGLALLNHLTFEQRGFLLMGVFDSNPELIGRKVRDWVIRDSKELKSFCCEYKPVAAILCVPQESAKQVVNDLASWDVKGFWNFTHYDLGACERNNDIVVENVHLSDSLMTLTYLIANRDSEH